MALGRRHLFFFLSLFSFFSYLDRIMSLLYPLSQCFLSPETLHCPQTPPAAQRIYTIPVSDNHYTQHISVVGGNNRTYTAVGLARLALVMKPVQSAKMVVKTWIRPSLCSGVSAKYKPYIDLTSRFAAARMVMSLAAVVMACRTI